MLIYKNELKAYGTKNDLFRKVFLLFLQNSNLLKSPSKFNRHVRAHHRSFLLKFSLLLKKKQKTKDPGSYNKHTVMSPNCFLTSKHTNTLLDVLWFSILPKDTSAHYQEKSGRHLSTGL